MATVAELVTKFIADTSSFTKGTAKVKKDAQGLGNTAKTAGGKMGGLNIATLKSAASMLGLAAAIGVAVRVAKQAVKIFAEFEQTMANVRAVTKATDEEFVLLNQAAKAAGETTRFTAQQAGDALYYLASAGLTATEATEALEGVLLLAGATGSDLAQTAETMTAIVSQFSLETEESVRVSNVFAAAIANSQATMDKLRNAFTQVGPVAAGLGISLEETTGALQILFNAGFRGQAAGRALKSALADLANESGVANLKLQNLGVAFNDVNPEAVGLEGSIRALQEAGLSTAQVIDVFGKVAGPQLSVLIKEGGDALAQYTEAVTDTNEAAEQYAIQNDTLKGDTDLLKSATQGLAIEFGEGLGPALRTLVTSFTDLIVFIKPFIRLLADVTGVILDLAFKAVKVLTQNLAFLGREFSRLIDFFEFGKKKTDELDESAKSYNSTMQAMNTIQQSINDALAERVRLEEELDRIQAARIKTIVDAREAAKQAFADTSRELQAQLDIGLISQKKFTDGMIKANQDLINSIIQIGIEGNYANLIDDAVINDALESIRFLTSANQELADTEAELEARREDAISAAELASIANKERLKAEQDELEKTQQAAEDLKQTYIDIAIGIPGQFASIFSALQGLRESQTDAAIQALNAEEAARIAAGENEIAVREDIEKKKAEIEYKGALAAWKLQLASSIATGAQVILNGFLTRPFIPAGLIAGALATTIAGLQIGAVSKAKPQKQFAIGTSGFQVPEGFPNDSFNVGLSSGERFSVDTPSQQASGVDGMMQTIIVQVADGPIIKTVNRGFADRKIQVPA